MSATIGRPWNIILDVFERGAVAGLCGWLAIRVLMGANFSAANCLFLASESAVALFIIMRRTSSSFSGRPMDWLLAFAGTALPLLVSPGGHPLAPPVVTGILVAVGMLIQFSAKIILFRSFGIVAANRGVKREGPYRFVRHPMYAGYLFTWAGFLLNNPAPLNAAIYAACLGLMIGRIVAEERILTEDAAYRAMRVAVPYRLAPGVW